MIKTQISFRKNNDKIDDKSQVFEIMYPKIEKDFKIHIKIIDNYYFNITLYFNIISLS